jgi:hypothetical protein
MLLHLYQMPLLIIDLQKGFASEMLAQRIEKEADLYPQVWQTQFVEGNPLYKRELRWEMTAAEKELWLPQFPTFTKTGYGLPPQVIIKLRMMKASRVQLAGADLDACILAAAFQLWDEGITPLVRPSLVEGKLSTQSWAIFARQFGMKSILEPITTS